MSEYYKSIKKYSNDDIYDDFINYDHHEFDESLINYDKYLEKNLDFNVDNPNEKILNIDIGSDWVLRLLETPLNSYYITSIDIDFSKIDYDNDNDDKSIRNFTSIPRYGDILNTIYLEITLPDNYNFNDLSLKEKFALFNINLDLTIGGVVIWGNTLLSNLFTILCTNINIKSDSNKIQIPIFDFSMMKTTKEFPLLFDYEKGLSPVCLQYNDIRIIMEIKKNITKFIKFKYIVKGMNLENKKRGFVAANSQSCCIILSNHEESNNLEFYNLKLINTLGLKALIIYFEPKNDDYIDYPKINFIEVIQDDIVTLIEQEDLLQFEIFDINMIILPLTTEFKSWRNINNFYENPHKYMSSDLVICKQKFYINIFYESKPDNFSIHFTKLMPNIYHHRDGMGGIMYN